MWRAPGVHVVAFVPVAGPVPPPTNVVTPRRERLVPLLRADEVDVRVDAPAVTMWPSPAMTSVVTPTIMPGVTPTITFGLPALPIADDAAAP